MPFDKKYPGNPGNPPRRANPPRNPVPRAVQDAEPGARRTLPARANDRPAFSPRGGDRPAYPPRNGDRPAYPPRGGDRPAYPPRGGDRPAYPPRGGDRPAYPPRNGDRPAYPPRNGDRPAYPPRNGDRPAYPPRNGDRPAFPPKKDDRPVYPPRVETPPQPAIAPDLPVREDAMPENMLVGRNPIREALKAGQTLEKLLVQRGELSGSAREIVAMAQDKHVVIQHVERARLDQIYSGHQGMIAFLAAAEYSTVEEILAVAKEKNEDALIVILDNITDPHNLGAILRSCECMGAHGVILPERRSVGLTPAAVKASAGAVSHIKVAKVVNLARTVEMLQGEGLWVTGAVMDGQSVETARLSGPMALVIGSEGEGISQLLTKKCDYLVSLPMYGQIGSLNASVAAGILLWEIAKARHAS